MESLAFCFMTAPNVSMETSHINFMCALIVNIRTNSVQLLSGNSYKLGDGAEF
jgi:hypothetical protein